MRGIKFTLFVFLLFGVSSSLKSQTISCPPNIDFEFGNFTNWYLYTGTCCPIAANTLTGAVANRHVITSGTATDPYGGFPVVAPGSGVYSLKLGNNSTGSQAERARYYVHVPSGVNNYSLIFRYAVVFQNPGHTAAQQPRFEVKAYDSITGNILPCSQFTFVSNANLPGFQLSTTTSTAAIWYKNWTTASINLSGYAGKTVAVDFASGDCSLGAHFGYGYVDMNCGLLPTNTVVCSYLPTFNITAPPGFAHYEWRDSALTTIIDTNQVGVIPTPSANKTFAVILTPYTGFGCPDTIYTNVTISHVAVNITNNDTTVCNGTTLQLNTTSSTDATPLTYSWTPISGLSCTGCTNPVVTLPVNTKYFFTATNKDNCSRTDSISIRASNISVALSKQNVSCYNGINGTMTVVPAGGKTPYTYSWNTSPAQTTATATGLAAGLYTVTVTDSLNCSKSGTDTIKQPTLLTIAAVKTDVACNGGSNGTATATAAGGTAPYTYSWNTSPAQTAATATGLVAGIYTVTVTDANNCTATASVTIGQPAQLSAAATSTDVSCNGGNNGSATVMATGGTVPYSYSWNTSPVKTTAIATGLAAGTYTVTVTDAHNCTATATATVGQPAQVTTLTSKTDVSCNGGSNGTATVAVAGGITPYTYSWNTTPVKTTATITGLTAATYTVTVTDANNCTATATALVGQPTALAASASKTDVSCNGGSNGAAVVTASGGTVPYTYSWNTSPVQTNATATGLAAGTYTVTVTDANSCTKTATVTIGQPAVLAATAAKTDVSCFSGNNGTATVTATGGTTAYIYSWNTSPAQTTATATGLIAGTYTVTITDAHNCITTATTTLGQPTALAATTVKTDASCYGGNNGTAAAIATGGIKPYTYSWNTSPVQTTTTAGNLTAGTYTITITDSNGCVATATAAIGQPNALAINTTTTNVACNGDANGTATATVTGGTAPYVYTWNSTPVQSTLTAGGLPAGSYTITVTDSKGCIATAVANVAQSAVLTVVTAKTDVDCFAGNNGTATATATGGTTPYSYNWNTSPVKTTASVNTLTAGNYAVTVTDNKGCTASAIAIINQPAQLSASVTKTDVACYNGNTGTAVVTASGGTVPYTYNWSSNPGQTNAIATGLTAGSYTVTVTDNKGCTFAQAAVISQPTQLISGISKSDVVCHGETNGTATVAASGGTAPYTYSWNTTPVQTTATVANISIGNYAVTVTDAKGCIATNNITVNEPQQLSHTVTKTDALCFGDSNGTVSVVAAGGSPAYTYSWNTTPVQTTASASGLSAGTYKVLLKDSRNCKDSASITIAQPSPLEVSTTKTDATCNAVHNGTATVNIAGGTTPYSYSWNTSPVQTTQTAGGLDTGVYTVLVTDAHGCHLSALTDTIRQPALLTAVAVPGKKTCAELSAGSVMVSASGGVGPYIYQWNTSPAQFTDTATGLAAGTYSVTITDANGCIQTAQASVLALPSPDVDAGIDQTVCLGKSTQLNASGTKLYTWTPSAGLSCNNCAAPFATPAATTIYRVTGTDTNGCVNTDSVIVNIIPRVNVSAAPDIDICVGDPAQLQAYGGIAYAWSPGEPVVNNHSIANPVAHTDTSMTFKVVITENECFNDTLYQHVRIHPRPVVELGPDKKGVPGATIQLNADTTNTISIAWTPETGLNCNDCYRPVATLSKTITYTATVSSGYCLAKDDITIVVGCDRELFFIPNTFTPNGDGVNDRFFPMAQGVNIIDRFLVYDRWGEPVHEVHNFSPNDAQYGWDGTFKGEQLHPDVYVYYMEAKCTNGERVFLKGDISLVR